MAKLYNVCGSTQAQQPTTPIIRTPKIRKTTHGDMCVGKWGFLLLLGVKTATATTAFSVEVSLKDRHISVT